MNKYANGKIYTIVDSAARETILYVGSTYDTLKHRFSIHQHKAPGREIRLYEKYPCKSKFELHLREEEVRKFLNPTLNKNRCCSCFDSTGMSKTDKNHTYHKLYKDEIHARKNQKVLCECGKTGSKNHIVRHKNGTFHHKLMILPHLRATLVRKVFKNTVTAV